MTLFFRKKEKKKSGRTSILTANRSPYRMHMPDMGRQHAGRKERKISKYKTAIRPPRAANNTGGNHTLKVILAVFLGTGIAGFFLYAIFFSNWFLIEKFELVEQGTVVENYEKMNEVLKKIIGQNLLLLSDGDIVREIKELHPEIEDLKVKKVLPATVRIEYTKYPTVANLINTVNGIQKKFLVDSQGFLVEENMDQPDLPHIHLETSEPLTLRSSFLSDPKRSAERLTYMRNAISLFEEKFGMKILYGEFYPTEREFHLSTEKYFFVLLDMEKSLNRQIEKLRLALGKLDIYTEPLLYIDLRISGTDTEKVIFKKK